MRDFKGLGASTIAHHGAPFLLMLPRPFAVGETIGKMTQGDQTTPVGNNSGQRQEISWSAGAHVCVRSSTQRGLSAVNGWS